MEKFNWKKQGLIFNPLGRFDWMQSHATTPTPLHLMDDCYRVFFSTRNKINQNQTAFIDINLNNPSKTLKMSQKPVFQMGQLGAFDCDGVYMTSILRYDNKLYGFYGGWNAGKRDLFYSKIGLAVSEDNGENFRRLSNAPILNIDEKDPLSVMAPHVIIDEGVWKMWYASASKFYRDNGQLKSIYTVKYATSNDGITWAKSNRIAIPLGEEDSNIARACILKNNNNYEAWYPVVSKMTNEYRIGYAESINGIDFERKDDIVGIEKSDVGWDSKAITYPYVLNHRNKLYLFYNGNNFGREGFGLAICDLNE